MKLIEREGGKLVFRLNGREKVLLERLTGFYPLRTDCDATISRDSAAELQDANELLAEAMRDKRQELSTWLSQRLHEGGLLNAKGKEWRLVLESDDVENLLQVLNELRVSSWVKLGKPQDLDAVSPSAEAAFAAAPLHALMMLAGQFQMVLVQALNGESEASSGT